MNTPRKTNRFHHSRIMAVYTQAAAVPDKELDLAWLIGLHLNKLDLDLSRPNQNAQLDRFRGR